VRPLRPEEGSNLNQSAVIVDEGAQENGLAVMLADLMSQNMEANPDKKRAFDWIKGSVAITAQDAEVSLTMFFNRGSCVVFDGVVGKPDLHVTGDSETILNLSNVPLFHGLPNLLDPAGQELAKKLVFRQLQIEGLPFHPLTLSLLTYVLSVAV
jgi:hypothetical protein